MNRKAPLKDEDPEIYEQIQNELKRRREGLELIPSENLTSKAVLEALGSILTDKYSEGFPGRRYYGGNEFIDKIEMLAIKRAMKAFKVPFANVQAYSGSPANQAVAFAVLKPGETLMGPDLPDGGHLTHGWKANFSGIYYKSVPYHCRADGYIDLEEARKLALEHKPKLIWTGFTAYSREFPFEEMAEIADEVGAYLAADIAHIAGLVVAGVHKSPAPYAHIITTTTHKTLRGPRGAIIMATDKGLSKEPELGNKIDKAIIPGLQGGPHNHQTAAIAVALHEAMQPEFREYAQQIVKNCKALAQALMENGLKIVSGGTDNHLMLIDLTPHGKGNGVFAQEALDAAGITVNKNTIPQEPSSPFYPSGIRLGTATVTTQGMKEREMKQIAELMAAVIDETRQYQLPEKKEERTAYIANFKKEIQANPRIMGTRQRVKELCSGFELY
ncbi:serine hydroxymethyltransferase [Candidatus Woesearchaeota archaeon]|nr:serine hydroxymethyltransferase [Candidatus Woesearchaeota archaeon]